MPEATEEKRNDDQDWVMLEMVRSVRYTMER